MVVYLYIYLLELLFSKIREGNGDAERPDRQALEARVWTLDSHITRGDLRARECVNIRLFRCMGVAGGGLCEKQNRNTYPK